MSVSDRIMSDYIVNVADVSTYCCDPMSFEEEFEAFAACDDEGLVKICIHRHGGRERFAPGLVRKVPAQDVNLVQLYSVREKFWKTIVSSTFTMSFS